MDNLDALSANLADELVGIIGGEGAVLEVATELLSFDRYSSVRFAAVFDAGGEMMHHYVHPLYFDSQQNFPELMTYDLNRIPEGSSFFESELVAKQIIGESDYTLGYLLVVNDYHGPLEVTMNSLYGKLVPLVLLVSLFTLLVDNLLIKRLMSPLARLADFAQEVTETGDYQLKVNVSGSEEINKLTRNINVMLSTIYEQTIKNQRYTAQLEQQQDSLEKLANYDTLTGLPNRKMFQVLLENEIANYKQSGSHLAVMFLDLDNFKHINDSLGHGTGDMLLIMVAEFIEQTLRSGDVVARFGGDEFLILIKNSEKIADLVHIAERIIERLRRPFQVKGWEVESGVSIGVATTLSSDCSAEVLIRHADLAMYHAKETGKSSCSFFDDKLLRESVRKVEIANAISTALVKDEFQVFYQPKVGPNGGIIGFEALIRWQSSYDGIIAPSEFIPIAEWCGKIGDITRYLISCVFREYRTIVKLVSTTIHISLNLSAHDLRDMSLIGFIRDEMVKNKVNPQHIEFEITESSYLENLENAALFLQEIGTLGSTVALDDFGTGYSSLSYLSQIEVDTLKIDHSFVKQLHESDKDRFIIQSIINLGISFSLNICAEGVETVSDRDALIDMGCHQLQGYLFSKPVPLGALAEALSAINRTNWQLKSHLSSN
ncbi:putative bifunctional diguanylate cyclase/phosphodiesterase [Oleiphilus messinensis]|nr:EAL domain-containing protein [Oleiphilus messinensis]